VRKKLKGIIKETRWKTVESYMDCESDFYFTSVEIFDSEVKAMARNCQELADRLADIDSAVEAALNPESEE